MGNTPSQPLLSSDAASSLSPRAQQRLSQAPYMNFFEAAAVAPEPSVVRRKNKTAETSSIHSSTTHSSGGSTIKASSSSRNGSAKSTADKHPSRTAMPSDTSTLTPVGEIVMDYVLLEGRQYIVHPEARFFLPTDQDEVDRLVILHFLLKYAIHSNFGAPVQSLLQANDARSRPQVLNVGCGSGTWVLEMANDYPNADVYGIDLRPMFPSASKPSNAKFIHHNIIEGLPFANNTFDYVHMRLMLCQLTQPQLVRMLSEISRVLRPMGYVEILDVDYRVQRPGPLTNVLMNQKLHAAMLKESIDLHICSQVATLLMTQAAGAGFINVQQKRTTIPLVWGDQLGQIHGQNLESFFRSLHPTIRESISHQPSTLSGQPEQQDHVLNDASIQELMAECEKFQSHLNWYVCYGQKPYLTEQQQQLLQSSHSHSSSVMAPHMLPMPPPPSMPPPPPFALPPSPTASTGARGMRHEFQDPNWESIDHFVDGFTE